MWDERENRIEIELSTPSEERRNKTRKKRDPGKPSDESETDNKEKNE